MQKDMTRKQYLAALKRRGFKPASHDPLGMEYVDISDGLYVSALNAPQNTYRSKLAYMIRQDKFWRKRMIEKEKEKNQ